MLSTLFDDIRAYWISNLPYKLVLSNEEGKFILDLPEDIKNPLVFFDIPFSQNKFYQENIFPSIKKLGLIPITEFDVTVESEYHNFAKEYIIIEKAMLVILDYKSSTLKDYIIKNYRTKKKIFLLESSKNEDESIENIVIRPRNLDNYSENIDFFIGNLIKKIKEVLNLKYKFKFDFEKLFIDGHYNSAVVFAYKELELKLNNIIDQKRFMSVYQSLEFLKGTLSHNYQSYIKKLDFYRPIRNKIVHEKYNVEKYKAEAIIDAIKQFLEILEEEKDKIREVLLSRRKDENDNIKPMF